MKKQASFADRLKEALVLRQMTKADLARITGISKSSLTHYEKGDWEGKQDAVYKIARALNVSEAWLMGFDTSESSAAEEKPVHVGGLSIETQEIAEIIESLPPDLRRVLLLQARALKSETSGQDDPE